MGTKAKRTQITGIAGYRAATVIIFGQQLEREHLTDLRGFEDINGAQVKNRGMPS
jgi:hypothetical protein